MKTLTQAYELIQLLSSLHFLSPTLVRTANPQTYTLNCVYSEEEVQNRDDNLRGNKYIKHIVSCGHYLSCDYYKRLSNNTGLDASVGGPAVLATTTTALMFASEISAPFTLGLSFVAISVLSFGSLAVGDYVSDNMIKKTIEEIENELKEKWEAEQRLNAERNN